VYAVQERGRGVKTVFMMRGLPASGKSTRAKEMLKEFGPGNAKIINKDLMRLMLDDGHWSRDNEKFLLGIRDHVITEALKVGKHVIVDDTNLAEKHEARLRQLAREGSASFEIVDFSHVSVEDCIKRDLGRAQSVGETVIRNMNAQFLANHAIAPAYDPALQDVVIVDIDGTIARMNGRGPYEWEKVITDHPRMIVMDAARGFGKPVLLVSGRDEGKTRAITVSWLERYFGAYLDLLMRPADDTRRDSIVKRELYEKNILGRYNVIAIFDDRPRVIRECWQDLGFGDRIFNVGDGTDF
jgi:predicted kinase